MPEVAPDRWVLVVANSGDADSGFVGERLEQRGYRLRTMLRDVEGLPGQVSASDLPALVLLLGSEWSVHEPVDPAALATECSLVRSAGAASVPVLGLCYGAQVLAQAWGGAVRPAARPEIGFIHVDTKDPALVPPGPWTAFHTDIVDPPPGAVEVARNDCGLQAFTLPGALAVQFHPEVRADVLDDWAARFPALVSATGQTRGQLVDLAREREPLSRRAAHRLVDSFLDRVVTQTATAAR